MKICVTVDMDNVQDYQRLVGDAGGGGTHSFYDDAVPRFLDLFDEVGIRATFFVVGRDAEKAPHRAALRRIAERGHEVANHSYTHPYNFRALSREEKAAEIDHCDAAIADAVGARPQGFRTPSFDVDLETLHMLRERGYLYDSSVMPSPLMWVFMIYGKLFIRSKHYQLGSPLAVFAPTRPYYPSGARLYREAGSDEVGAPGLLEIPGSVVPALRLPFYATVLRLLPPRVLDWSLRRYRDQPVMNALFHLLDLADLDAEGLGGSLGRTPGIAVGKDRRLRFASHAVAALAASGAGATLSEFARDWTEAERKGDRRAMTESEAPLPLKDRLLNRAEEWIYALNERQHPIFRLYDWGNEVWAKIRFRGVRRRARDFVRTLPGKGDTAELRFLTPEDLDVFADLLARFDFKYLPPHPLDRENAAWALNRSSYLPYGIFYHGELVGYTLVRLFFPDRAVTGVWSIPTNHNRGFSQVAVKTTAEFTLSEGLSDWVTVPIDNPYSLKGAQWAGWKIVRTNRRFHVLRHH